jgi:hypothetical protein
LKSMIVAAAVAAAVMTSTATAKPMKAASFVVYQGYTNEVIGTCDGKGCWRAIVKATPGKNERVVRYRTKRNGEVRAVQIREPKGSGTRRAKRRAKA